MLYALYARLLRRQVRKVPRHVGLVMDGNRRWAREQGFDNPSVGHRYGVEHIGTVLGWCAELGIQEVTIYVASADNVRKRESQQVATYMELIEEIIAGRLVASSPLWRLRVAGRLDELPDSTAHALKEAVDATRDRPRELTLAIGYDGRQEIVDAVRGLLESGEEITEEAISARIHVPDPDLIIRTSGERRLSGFLLWGSPRAELHFCDVYWPGFRRVDFLRALRAYSARCAP
ncbi:polyprenyl diphosphate synthase [Nonomuraea sp. NPDC050556]|uniref:polyprenyl diphosphate synthase n=1 Tax=Nonomuraea sp. NPDC050556 TaxID=3364369 RepID=UPI0037A5FA4C